MKNLPIEIAIPKGTKTIGLWALNEQNMLLPIFVCSMEEMAAAGFPGHLFQLLCAGQISQLNETPPECLASTPHDEEPLQDTNNLTGGRPALGSEDLIISLFPETEQSNGVCDSDIETSRIVSSNV